MSIILSQISNKRLTQLAVAVAAVSSLSLLPAASATVTGTPSVDFNTTITVKSSVICTLTVTPPADTTFAAAYTYDAVSTPNGDMVLTSANKAPRYIMVKADGGESCGVNAVKMSVNTTVNNRNVRSSPNSSGGIWELRPDFNDARVYTDPQALPSTPSETKVAVDDQQNSQYYYNDTADSQAGTIGNLALGGGSKVLRLANHYRQGNIVIPGLTNFLSFADSTKTYKALALGIGGYLALQPMDASGQPKPALAADGDVASIPFTVTITSA